MFLKETILLQIQTMSQIGIYNVTTYILDL
jgi:hypothetical protein